MFRKSAPRRPWRPSIGCRKLSDHVSDRRDDGADARFSRRRALQGMAAGLGALTAGCRRAPPPIVGSAPDPEAQRLLAGIDTFVVVMMENRSFDHLLGALAF